MQTKLILAAVAMLCVLRGTALSQAPTVPAVINAPAVAGAAAVTNAPKIASDMASFDFGEHDEASPVIHEFNIRNAGNADLIIKNVKTSCGCTAASPSTNRIEPGGQATIRTSLNLQGRRGAQSKVINIESNDPTTPQFSLFLTGTAVAELSLEPPFLSFGNVGINSNTSREVRLIARKPDIHITNVVCDSPAFHVEVAAPQPGQPPTVIVSTVPPLPSGQTRGTLHVYTDHPERKEVLATAMVMVLPEVRVLPDEISVRGQTGGTTHAALLIMPGTVREYQVLSVESPIPTMKTQLRMTAAGTYCLEITNIPVGPEIEGKKLLIHTSLKTMHEIAVPFHFVQEPPQS